MSSPSSSVQSSQISSTTAAAAEEQTSVAANGGSPNGGNVSMDTSISSVGDLREKAPKVYDAMLIGIATTICNRSKRHQDRIKKIMREGNR